MYSLIIGSCSDCCNPMNIRNSMTTVLKEDVEVQLFCVTLFHLTQFSQNTIVMADCQFAVLVLLQCSK